METKGSQELFNQPTWLAQQAASSANDPASKDSVGTAEEGTSSSLGKHAQEYVYPHTCVHMGTYTHACTHVNTQMTGTHVNTHM